MTDTRLTISLALIVGLCSATLPLGRRARADDLSEPPPAEVAEAADETEESAHLFSFLDDDRAALEEKGVTFEAVLTHEFVANTRGGLSRSEGLLGNVDLTLGIDTEKAGLWDKGTFFFYVLGNYGRNPSTWVGDTQVTSNIDTNETIKLYEAWYEHRFFDDSFSLLAGLHDYNSEFYVLELAGNLLHSSFGIGPDASQVGPSIFSTTALGVRGKYLPHDMVYVQGALYDGVPGDPNRPRGTRIRLDSNDGLFAAGEVGVHAREGEHYWKVGAGGWYLTAEVEALDGRTLHNNAGGYAIAESMLLYEDEAHEQGLGAFVQYGMARPDVNQVGTYVGAGVTYIGLLPCRDSDVASFGVAYARNSSVYRGTAEDIEMAETAYELNYRIEVTPYLAVTPDLQFVHNPGTTKGVKDATVLGVRAELAL